MIAARITLLLTIALVGAAILGLGRCSPYIENGMICRGNICWYHK